MDSKKKKKKKWSDLPDSIMEMIQIVPSEPDVIHFTNIKTKPKKETLTPKQKAAWLRSQRPEYAERSYKDRDKSAEAEASNNNIGELLDDLSLKTMSLPFETYDHLQEVKEQADDMEEFIHDHLDRYGYDTEMTTALELIIVRQNKIEKEIIKRDQEAVTGRSDL